MKKNKLFILFLLMLLFSIAIYAESNLPIGLQKIQEYQQQQAQFYLQNISFLVAFLGGILSFLLPCTIAILPAFFAYTFKEKKNLTKMTSIFFLGFSLVFIIFGILAAALGKTLVTFQVSNKLTVSIAGIFLILFGIMTAFGKGFSSFIKPLQSVKHDNLGIFLFGIFFAMGWSACLGPILAGILLIASTFKSYFISSLLLFSYSLGIFLPLFFISFFYDRFDLSKKTWIRGKELTIGSSRIHSTNLVSGILLLIAGIVFLVYSGTTVVQQNITYTTDFVYTLERNIIGLAYINWIGFGVLGLFVYLLVRFLRQGKNT